MTHEVSLEEQLAQWAAEDAQLLAEGAAKREYDALINELYDLGAGIRQDRIANGNFDYIDFADESCDHESATDAGLTYGSVEYWEACLCAAQCAAGSRAEDQGLDINALLGRVIY